MEEPWRAVPKVSRGRPAQAQHLRFLGCTDFAGGGTWLPQGLHPEESGTRAG